MKTKLLILTALMPFMAMAQNAYDYEGERVALEPHYFQSQNLGKLSGDKKLGYQGMDIYNGYMMSAQETGVLTIYKIEKGDIDKQKQFKLASYGKDVVANTIAFGVEKVNADDKFPVIYVSQYSKDIRNGRTCMAFVEQIANNLKSSKLVQTIYFEGTEGKPLQWTVDRDNHFLYALMNTNKWGKTGGKHQILKFRLPLLSEGEDVMLRKDEVIENVLIEDAFQNSFSQVIQGMHIYDGMLFLLAGDGATNPSVLYVWDLAAKAMRNVIDLSAATKGELTDCAVCDGSLYVQTRGQLYKLTF